MVKNICARNFILIITGTIIFILDICIICIWASTEMFSGLVKVSQSFSFNILTIDAVFAGFAYNTLGTMTSFSTNEKVASFDSDGYLDRYYNGVYVTLFLFVAAMILGAGTAFSRIGDMHHFIYLVQLILNMNAMVFFVLSIFGFRNLINYIRGN